MIHVAPCFCELHVRIRELEAELAYFRRNTDRGILRAIDDLRARAEKAEARVAELERELHFAGVHPLDALPEHDFSCRWEQGVCIGGPLHEAREREAD